MSSVVKRSVLWVVCFFGAVCWADQRQPQADSGTPDDQQLEARAILEKADEATRAVRDAHYSFHVTGLGYLSAVVRELRGTAMVAGEHQFGMDRFLIDIDRPESPDKKADHFVVGSNGDLFFLFDSSTKLAHVDSSPAVLGDRAYLARGAIMAEYCHPTPFQDEIRGDKAELRGTRVIAGVPCDEVYVAYSGGRAEAVWYFGKEDHLPRRVDRLYVNQVGKRGARRTTILDLRTNAKPKDKAFDVKIPDGFVRTSKHASDSRRVW